MPALPQRRALRVALAWVIGLGLIQGGATIYFARHAAWLASRASDLAGAGLFAPPAGRAAEALQAPAAWHLAALPYTLTLGVGLVMLAHLSEDLCARSARLRRLPVLVAVVATAVLGGHFGAPALWAGLCTAFLLPYGLLLQGRTKQYPRDPVGTVLGRWAAVVLLLMPAMTVVTPDHLTQARTVLLQLPGGEAAVDRYYRHAVLAAEPIKRPQQRFYQTYSGASALPPAWRCAREPFVLLPVDARHHGDWLIVPPEREGGAPVLRRPGAETASGIELAQLRSAGLDSAYRDGLRGLLVIAVPLGMPLALAYGVAHVAAAVTGRRGWGAVLLCVPLGLALAAALASAADSGTVASADSGGTALQRMQAAAAPDTHPDDLAHLARADALAAVRARALAERVRRAERLQPRIREVARAQTWYEQWYGYRALMARGWHPLPACRGRGRHERAG